MACIQPLCHVNTAQDFAATGWAYSVMRGPTSGIKRIHEGRTGTKLRLRVESDNEDTVLGRRGPEKQQVQDPIAKGGIENDSVQTNYKPIRQLFHYDNLSIIAIFVKKACKWNKQKK